MAMESGAGAWHMRAEAAGEGPAGIARGCPGW